MTKTAKKSYVALPKKKTQSQPTNKMVSVAFELEKIPQVDDSIIIFEHKIGQSVQDDTLLTNWIL